MGTKSNSTFVPTIWLYFDTRFRVFRLIVLWWGALRLPYPLKLKFCIITTLIRRFHLFYSQTHLDKFISHLVLSIEPLWLDNNSVLKNKRGPKWSKLRSKVKKYDISYKIRVRPLSSLVCHIELSNLCCNVPNIFLHMTA